MKKSEWLSKLYYDIGKQQTDFRITSTWVQDGETKFTKWINYLQVQGDDKLISKANQREQLKNEIILDLDEGTWQDYLDLIDKLKEEGVFFAAYATEEKRARHIHTFWKGLSNLTKHDREQIRKKFISKYGCDLNLCIDSHVIPIEHVEHWKTGKKKELTCEIKGVNSAKPFVDELKEEKLQKLMQNVKPGTLTITNYLQNAEKFYDMQPYFYDENKIFWFWNDTDKMYSIVDEVDIMRCFDKILGFAGQAVNNKVKSHTLEALKWYGREKKPKEAPTKWIQFKDKAYSLTSGKVYDVQPNYFFTNPIPWELGESEDIPVIDRLFTDWVGESHKQTLYEILAYCMYQSYPIQSIICLIGGGRNGKSQYTKILSKLLGHDNVTSTELDLLTGSTQSRFESFKLYKKLACLLGETNFGVLSKSSVLKKLTGGDLIGFEMKGKTPFTDLNYAKIIICTNSLPISDDTSEGFYRRWVILDFPNNFPEGKDIVDTIPDEEYNNLALKCCRLLPKLLHEGKFSNHGSIKERRQKYIMASNPLVFFIQKYCKVGYDEYVQYGELFVRYAQYLKAMNRRQVSRKEFSKVLAEEGYVSRKGWKENENGYFVEGISLQEGLNVKYSEELASRDQCDSCDTIPTPSLMCRKGVGNSVTLVTSVTKYDEIQLPCYICGLKPTKQYDSDAGGKPICEFCLQNKEEVIETEEEDV